MSDPRLNIAVFAGDGIGPEVMASALAVLRDVQRRVGGFRCDYEELPAGALCYRDTGESLPRASLARAEAADAILLGACGWPEVRYPDGTEIRPQVELRFHFELYAGVRPIRFHPGVPPVLVNPQGRPIDLVIVRESTEGLFASRGSGANPAVATETMVITRRTTERLMRFSYGLARQRKAQGHAGRLTCVDKANIFSAMAFFRGIYEEVGAAFPDVTRDTCYVDAMAHNLVRRPWDYDVMVMENMFGDILSDLGAGLIGGMGMAPSGDIGDSHAVFQPSRGSAPDIAGQGRANPLGMILSGAMMLRYLGEQSALDAPLRAAEAVEGAVAAMLAAGTALPQSLPPDLGGQAGTAQVTEAVLAALARTAPAAVPMAGSST